VGSAVPPRALAVQYTLERAEGGHSHQPQLSAWPLLLSAVSAGCSGSLARHLWGRVRQDSRLEPQSGRLGTARSAQVQPLELPMAHSVRPLPPHSRYLW
jgi:hypothetical protein